MTAMRQLPPIRNNRSGRCLAALLILPALAGPVPGARAAPQSWWNPAWPYRARIECPAGEGNVAELTVTLAGRSMPDGRDIRLIDASGRPRNFEILHHDPLLTTTLQIAVPPGQALTAWLYFGNNRAPLADPTRIAGIPSQRAAEVHAQWRRAQAERRQALERQQQMQDRLAELRQMEQNAARAGNVPAAALNQLRENIRQIDAQLKALKIPPDEPEPDDPTRWHARRGLILRVYRKSREGHPPTLDALRQLIATSTPDGGGFRKGISDGFNPFGTSDHYISVYSGYLRIDKPGEYAFCSASDDGSWLLVDGKPLVEWPGPHTWEGAAHGEKSGKVSLEPGVTRIDYFHEEGQDSQLAYLGWKPPGAERFEPVPEAQWTSVRTATASEYEARGKPVMALPEIKIVSTWWIRDTDDQQATLVEFIDRSRSAAGSIRDQQWSFGDGLTERSQPVRHLYFRTGRPAVELTVTDAQGNQDTVTCSPNIYALDVQSNAFEYADAKQYAKIAARYEPDKMTRDDLQAMADFWNQVEDWGQAARTTEAYLRRFPDGPAAARLAGAAARAFSEPAGYDPKKADGFLKQALAGAKDDAGRRELQLRRAKLLAWDLADLKTAENLYHELQKAAAALRGDAAKDLQRQCLIGLGDTALLAGDLEKAGRLYDQAAPLARRKPSDPEEMAKLGSYPYSVDDFLARGEFEWAVKTLDEWEDDFPAHKLRGLTFFLRGKVLYVQHPGEQALRFLALAEQVNPRGVFVPEALWLHANCLMALQRYADALNDLHRIRNDFTQTEFFNQAAARIAECEGKLPKQAATRPGDRR